MRIDKSAYDYVTNSAEVTPGRIQTKVEPLLLMKTVKYRHLLLATISIVSVVWAINAQNPTTNMMAPAQMNLMPVPASVQIQAGRLPITSGFNVVVKNFTDDRLRAKTDGHTVLRKVH